MRKTYFPWICGGWIFSTSQLLIDGNWSLPRESATQNPYQPLLAGSQFFQLISIGGKLFREIYAKYDTPTLHRGDTMSRTFWAMDHKELSSSNGLLQTWNFKMSSICESVYFHVWKCSAELETSLLCHGMQRLRSCPSVQREGKMTGKSVLWIKVLTAMCIIILPRRFDSAVTGEEQMKNWKPSGKYISYLKRICSWWA